MKLVYIEFCQYHVKCGFRITNSPRFVSYSKAGVVEWQTRGTQNPVRRKPREGSTPSPGTKLSLVGGLSSLQFKFYWIGMRLYRGIKTKNFTDISLIDKNRAEEDWKEVLNLRKHGKVNYPEDLDLTIKNLHKLQRLNFQNFTDIKEIAEKYAKTNNGLLVELNVSIEDIIKYFHLEIQNYQKRREKFEIVYTISGKALSENKDKWEFKLIDF